MQLLPDNEQIRSVVKKFMDGFFNDELEIKLGYGEDMFETPAICRSVKRMIGNEFMEHVANRYRDIEAQKIKSRHHPSAKNYSSFFLKLGLLINTRILGEQV